MLAKINFPLNMQQVFANHLSSAAVLRFLGFRLPTIQLLTKLVQGHSF